MGCVIEDCSSTAEVPILLSELLGRTSQKMGPSAVAACVFHAHALRAGEPFAEAPNGKLRLGVSVPPRLLNFRVTMFAHQLPQMVLELGRDGIVEQSIPIQISEDLADHLMMNDDSELAKEADRNPIAND